jgi:hypothetical protein
LLDSGLSFLHGSFSAGVTPYRTQRTERQVGIARIVYSKSDLLDQIRDLTWNETVGYSQMTVDQLLDEIMADLVDSCFEYGSVEETVTELYEEAD